MRRIIRNIKRHWLLSTAFLLLLLTIHACQLQTKEQRFWKWFTANESRFYAEEEVDEALLDEMGEQLNEVDDGLAFEFSPIQLDGKKDFFVSADGIRETFPVVEKLVATAPKFKQWRIYAFRQRTPDDFSKLTMNGHTISYEDIYFRYAPDSTTIDVELNVKGYDGKASFKQGIYIMLDALLGEYDAVTRIDGLSVIPLDEAKRGSLFKFVELREVIDDLKSKSPQKTVQ